MGPLLLSRLLELNETQEGVLNILFRVAADEKMPLLDLKDLRAMANDIGQRGKSLITQYGNVSAVSVGAIQRRLLVLEEQGAGNFFGEPALDIKDFIRTTSDGRGTINILAADNLMKTPRLYATFLLWMLAQLFDKLPEIGDPEKPKLVFFFDEAHLLFNEAPKALLDQVERVTRLIRSKGVGVYYVTQNPRDVPTPVSAQLGNPVQHAQRAFPPIEQRGNRAAAETFRPNPDLDIERVIQELKVGEALVSVLEQGGAPSMVQRTLIRPPSGRLGPVSPQDVFGDGGVVDRLDRHRRLSPEASGRNGQIKACRNFYFRRRDHRRADLLCAGSVESPVHAAPDFGGRGRRLLVGVTYYGRRQQTNSNLLS
jgi:DNA helicase HerA-like ATPase